MTRTVLVLGLVGIAMAAAACGDRAPLTGEADVEGVEPALRPRPPAPPVVLATVPEEAVVGGLLVRGGTVLFGSAHDVERPPEEVGSPFITVGSLRRVPAAGGAVDTLWTGNGAINDIALAANALLFLAYDFNSRTGHLNRLPDGGTAVELANWFSHGSSHSLDSAADVAYWTHSAGAGTFVKRTTADGTTVTLTDAETLQAGSADNIVFKDGSVYFVASGAQRIVFSMPADGSAPPASLYAAAQIDALAAVPNQPALVAGAGPSLVAIDLRNGNTRTLFTGTANIISIAVDLDARAVYFGTFDFNAGGAGAVTRFGRPGGAVVLASGTMMPSAVAVDATSVYWVDATNRTVSKAAK